MSCMFPVRPSSFLGLCAAMLGLALISAPAAGATGSDAVERAAKPRAGAGKQMSGGATRSVKGDGKGKDKPAVGTTAVGARPPRSAPADRPRAGRPAHSAGPKGGAEDARPGRSGALLSGGRSPSAGNHSDASATPQRPRPAPRAAPRVPSRPRPGVDGGPRVAGPQLRPSSPPAHSTTRHDAQKTTVNRAGTVAVGLRGGALGSTLDGGGASLDPGLGLAVRVRPLNMFGVEASYLHHGGGLGGAALGVDPQGRTHDSFSASGQLFFTPRQVLSPFVSLGGTWQLQHVESQQPTMVATVPTSTQQRLGLHGGLGVELNLGQHLGLGLEVRALHDRNHDGSDPLGQMQVQALGGLNLYF